MPLPTSYGIALGWHVGPGQTIADPNLLAITGSPVLTAIENVAYTGFQCTATGGEPPYVFSLVGLWPSGLAIDPATGIVSDIPITHSAGTYPNLSVRVTDAANNFAELPASTIAVSLPVPTFSVAPTLSYSAAQEGVVVTCNPGTAGPSVTGYTFQFIRDAATTISGAVNAAYTFAAADVTHTAKCTVTATNPSGSVSATTAATPTIIAASPGVPVYSVAPVVTGTARVGQTLTVAHGTASNSPSSYADQWQRVGVNIAGATGLTYVQVAADAGKAITCVERAINAGGSSVPSTSNTINVYDGLPVSVTIPGTGGGRPIGLGYNPAYAGAVYNQSTDIPAGALRLSAYASFALAIAACRSSSKALIVDQDASLTSADLGYSNVELYGFDVSGRDPILTMTVTLSSAVKAFMYAVDGSIKARGITFTGFGSIYCIATGSNFSPTYPYHTGSTYGFPRAVPLGMDIPSTTSNGIGIGIDTSIYPLVLGGRGPDVDIRDCTFINCENVCYTISDSHYRVVNFHRCLLDGTYGGLDIDDTVCPDLYVSQIEHKNCTGARIMPNINWHGVHTTIKVSPDQGYVHKLVRTHTIYVENNYPHDISDNKSSDGLNCAVFCDLRNVNPASFGTYTGYADRYTTDCSVRIGHNRCVNMIGTLGQEDCNPFYGKMLGGIFEYNYMQNCGAPDLRLIDPTKSTFYDGSECNGILLKEAGDFIGAATNAFLIIRYNEIVDPPSKTIVSVTSTNANNPNAFVIKTDNYAIPLYIIGNVIRRHIITVAGTQGTIRPIGNMPAGVWVEDNGFDDCTMSSGGQLVRLHNASVGSGKGSAVKNNVAVAGTAQEYSANQSLVTSVSNVSVTGNTCTGNVPPNADSAHSTWSMQGGTGPATAAIALPVIPSVGTLPLTAPLLVNGEQLYVKAA